MKKVLSLLLAVMMVISLCPVTALADGELLELQPIAEQEEQIDEQEEEPAAEVPAEEEPAAEQEQQTENVIDQLVLGAENEATAAANSENGGYNETGISFDENGVYGQNCTLDTEFHVGGVRMYVRNADGKVINCYATLNKTYSFQVRSSEVTLRNNSSATVYLAGTTAEGAGAVFEAGEEKKLSDLQGIRVDSTFLKNNGYREVSSFATEYYLAYIEKVNIDGTDKYLGATILIEVIPEKTYMNGQEYGLERTELTGWNRINSDGSTERVECSNIYMLTLPYGDENITLDWNADKYTGQALGSERTSFNNVSFTELFNNSDYAVTGDKKAEGVSCTALFGETLPGTLSDRDKVIFVAGYNADGSVKAGIIVRVYIADRGKTEISTAEELAAYRDYVNSGNTERNAVLMADIDLSSVCGEGIGSWTPIKEFAGTFDGNGHTISNLYIANDTDKAALFDTITESGTVKNLGIISANIVRTKAAPTASVVAIDAYGIIENCYTKDCSITTWGNTATLFCSSSYGTIRDCYVINGTISDMKNRNFIRSFIRSGDPTIIENCYVANVKLNTTKALTESFAFNDKTTDVNVVNCYALSSDNNASKWAVAKDEEWFKSDEALAALGSEWERDVNDKNGGFPVLKIRSDGGTGTDENHAPMRRKNVSEWEELTVDESLKCTIDLSKVFYDADGDELTYKVRIGEEGEYVPIEGSSYTYNFDKDSFDDVELEFTANDGKTDGGKYYVTVSISDEMLISRFEAIVADPSDYWTEDDRWNGTEYTPGGFFRAFKNALSSFKADTSSSTYKRKLITAYGKLMPKTKVNASRIYDAAVRNYRDDFSYYTEVSVTPYIEAQAAAVALYADGAIANEAYTEEKQAEIYRVYDAWSEAIKNLVWKENYKTAFEYYQKNKDEAKKLLELYNPAKYTESDYTAESWQAFVGAWNDLKADVDFVFDEESGTTREWNMLKDFEKHMKALPQAFADLVSAIDITISFKYIENMHFRYTVTNAGTSGYVNPEFKLAAGATTLEGAFNAANISLYSFNTNRAQVKERMTLNNTEVMSKGRYALFINGTYIATGTIDALKKYQLHNNDDVVVARITAQYEGGEASSGYDSTTWSYIDRIEPTGYENSVGLITINSVTQNAKVGDSVTIKASAKTAYPSNLGKRLNAEGLALLISEPSEENVVSQNWQNTVFTTSAKGTIDYVFTEPGYYTVAIVNNKYDEPTLTNVYGVTTVGTYNTLMIGDFTTVYIAPADDPDALAAKQREKNLAEAKAYFEQLKYYDFNDGYYEDTLVPMYKALVENQKNAKTFKELVNSYNSDFSELQNTVNKNLRNHEAMVEELRGYLRNIPADLSEINYSYSYIVGEIQRIYGGMNDYEKNLLSDKERELAEKLMLLDANNLPTGKKVTIDVQKDANMVLAGDYGWLPSAPNENIVYKFTVGYGESQKYYKWTTAGGGVATPGGGNDGAEPSDEGMTAYPGDIVHARRLVETSDDAYWMVFSYDGGNTWNLSTKVDGGEGMFSADFTMPETDADTLVFALKMISKAEYEKMRLEAETPEMALEEAQAAYKAALEEAFASYDRDRYAAENYTALRYAKEDGITNINNAKTVTAVVNYFNIALEAMKAVPQKAQVYVEVKNETFTESYVDDDGNTITPPWTGTLVAKWVNIDEDSTMMTCIVDALEGHTVMGAESNYISSIDGLGEFGGGPGSGWMGTLNDWFTNFGFGEFSVANGTLKAGDRISVMYTCTLGSDIGGAVEGNTDTSLKALSATNGTLAPAFDKETTSYLLTMDEGKHTVTLNYTANNKAFQVRTYLNQYTPSSDDYYACGETISVKEGDIIYVSCGDPAWPSMAGNDALKIIPHVYEITVVGSSGAVEKLIKALPAPEKLEYSDKGDVENAERLFDALGEDEQAKLDEQLKAKLRKCIERMAELERVNAVEELIAALPAKLPISDEEKVKVDEAKDAFDALGEELQKDVKSVYTNKLLSLLGQQKIYFDYQGGKENTKLLFTQKDGKLAVLPGTTKENYHFDGWYTEKDGGTQISLETIFTESCKLYAHWLDNVQYVEKLISAIGEVELTDECKERIDAARAAVDALSEEDKVNVSNYEVLTAAEAEYARLVKEAEDKAAAKAVDDLIAAIGEVKLTEECDAKIKAARKAFNALTPEQKAFVKNEKALTDAEAEYQKLFDQHKADEAAAKAVDEAVAKLAPVTLESGNAVKAARKAFDALTPEQKKLLDPKTEDKLVVAENEYKKLVKEDADKKAAKEVEDKIAALQPVTKDSGEAIKDARSSYEALTPEQKALVSKDSVAALDKAEKSYDMIIASTKPGTAVGDNTGSTSGSGVIKITANAAAKGEQNPHTGAPVMSMAPAVLVLAAAALVLKKHK